MARKSKLAESQWNEILDRHLAGESIRSLAREYGVSEGAIRQKITTHAKKIKSVAKQVVRIETELERLPISTQVHVRNHADRLKVISGHIAGAAEYGAATAHRLAQIANVQTEKIDEVNPEENVETIKTIAALTRMANEAASLAINLAKVGENKNREVQPTNEALSGDALKEELAKRGLPTDIFEE